MRILVVARCKKGRYAPFIIEQVEAVENRGIECHFFGVNDKGVIGYLRQIPKLKKIIRDYKPDVIHSHYGLCGLLANYQRKVPVVTTYHGSDINNPKVLYLSKLSICLSRFNIFVSQKNIDIAKPHKPFALIPCGINLDDCQIIERSAAREALGLDLFKKYVLFAGAFDNPVKNVSLAKAVMKYVPNAELLELKGYSRPQVVILMQAVDSLLMTSITEGSPQVIKEALACGCPIVSVDVGDVKERVSEVAGCFVAKTYEPEELAGLLRKALLFEGRTRGFERVVSDGLDNVNIAERLMNIYTSAVNNESI